MPPQKEVVEDETNANDNIKINLDISQQLLDLRRELEEMRRENRELWMQENKHNNKRSKVTFPRLDDVMEIKDEIRKEVDHDM